MQGARGRCCGVNAACCTLWCAAGAGAAGCPWVRSHDASSACLPAHPLHTQVGLRPGRPSVRLELEQWALDDGAGGSAGSIPVVHNYGCGCGRGGAQRGYCTVLHWNPSGSGCRSRVTGACLLLCLQSTHPLLCSVHPPMQTMPSLHPSRYRHGGAGLTLAWGCAADATALVQQALGRQ